MRSFIFKKGIGFRDGGISLKNYEKIKVRERLSKINILNPIENNYIYTFYNIKFYGEKNDYCTLFIGENLKEYGKELLINNNENFNKSSYKEVKNIKIEPSIKSDILKDEYIILLPGGFFLIEMKSSDFLCLNFNYKREKIM